MASRKSKRSPYRIHPDLAGLAWPVAELELLPGNPRQGDVDAVARSYERFGQRKPIVGRIIDGKRIVLAGNHQLLAARDRLGWSDIAVIWTDDDDLTAEAFSLADNRTAELGSYDGGLLDQMIARVAVDADLLAATAWTEAEAAKITQLPAMTAPEGADDVGEAPAIARSTETDVWLLGDHRVACGSSLDLHVLETALAGARARLVVTSPPYNQKIDAFKPSGMHKEGATPWVEKVGRLAYADSQPEPEYQADQLVLLANLHEVVADNGSVFYNHKNRYRDKQVVSPLEWLPGPFRFRQEIIWRRPGSVTQNARMFLPCDERIYWLYKGGDFHFNDTTEIKTWSSVWDISPRTNKEHPVAFPLDLPLRCIQATTVPGDLVVDPYGGSGTTLIAAETLGRRAVLVERDPKFVDLICRRWQEHTGRLPVNEATKQEHDFTEEREAA